MKAIYNFSVDTIRDKRFDGGRIVEQGIKEGAIDIIKDPDVIGDKLVDDLIKIQGKIIDGELIVLSTKYELDLFKSKV
ncbi:BMP family ABC transporter substrate-binding protein [Candidatus Borreliella tachyglossi]|uniref:BMP family ABC transporter substrate-binding protein n=1 Tax=Candidatus Borreliella tachyglossi TaxID=1964448 RepID=UPI004042DCAA